MTKRSRAMIAKVRKYLESNPQADAKTVSTATGASLSYVYNVRYMDKKKGAANTPAVKKPDWKLLGVSTSKEAIHLKERLVEMQNNIIAKHHTDMVNHPPHYKMGGIETIDFIEAKGFGYNLGNVVKYISRADHKGNHYEDLCKARWYLNREIAKYTPQETK